MVRQVQSILVVDDAPNSASLIHAAISEIADAPYEFSIQSSPEGALSALDAQKFDVILTGYSFGASTGVDLIKVIRARGISTPIILLSDNADKNVDEFALAAGASDYLDKSTLTGLIIDRAMRYAIARAQRQDLLSSVFVNAEAAICIVDDAGVPKIWNAKFSALAFSQFPENSENTAIGKLAEQLSQMNESASLYNSRYKKTTTALPDGRRILTLQDISEHLEALKTREVAEEKAAHQAEHCFFDRAAKSPSIQ